MCIRVVKHLEEKSEEKVQVTEFGSYARGFTDGINLKRETNRCCHPHCILAGYTDEESQTKFIKLIYFTMCDNEQVNLFQYLLQKEANFSKYYTKRLSRIYCLD